MNIGYKLRNTAFYTLDKIKGAEVSKNIKEFDDYYKNENQEIEEIQNQRFKDLIKHASSTTKFYKEYNDSLKLSDFPVIKKSMIQENPDSFISDKYNKDELIKVTTSGSYGTPTVFYMNKNKKKRQQAEVIFYSKWAFYDVGVKHAYIRMKVNKSKLGLKLQNQVWLSPVSITNKWLKEQIEILIKQKVEVIIGYPSAIEALAKYAIQNGYTSDKFKIKGVITSSESLYEEGRQNIKQAFDCEVISRYGTEETGILATECTKEGTHHINELNYIVEVLKMDSDEKADIGEKGRVVVTDLFSHAMPLIRYEIGDLAILGDKCGCNTKGKTLTKLVGRTVEIIYNTKDEVVLPFAINSSLNSITSIVQYQFMQKDKDIYKIKLKVSDNFTDEKDVINNLKDILGEDANINLEYVDDIKPLKSGKRPYIISEYKK